MCSESLSEARVNLTQLTQNQQQALNETTERIEKLSQQSREAHNQLLDLSSFIANRLERIYSLDVTILGELWSFKSVVFYTFEVILIFILTMSERTIRARFWATILTAFQYFLEGLLQNELTQEGFEPEKVVQVWANL